MTEKNQAPEGGLRAAAQKALDYFDSPADSCFSDRDLAALRAALAARPHPAGYKAALAARSATAIACLPDAPYKVALQKLHDDMLAAIADQSASSGVSSTAPGFSSGVSGAHGIPAPKSPPMTADLIKRLEAAYKSSMPLGDLWNLCAEAADELERLTSQAPAEDDRAAFREYLRECDDCAIVPDVGGAFNWAWQRASKAQPKRTAAPHVGETRFEGWLSCHEPDRNANRTLRYSKQDMRDAYWAGYSERGEAQAPAPAPETQHDGWNGPYNCIAAGPTATDVALHRAMNEAAKVGNRDDDKLIRKALNDAGYYLVRSMKKPGTCEHLLAVPCAAVAHAPLTKPVIEQEFLRIRRLLPERQGLVAFDSFIDGVRFAERKHRIGEAKPPVQGSQS